MHERGRVVIVYRARDHCTVAASDAETLDHLKFWEATAEMYKNKGKHQKAPWTGRFSVRFGGAAAPAAEGGIASDEGSGCASESSDSSNAS